MSNRKIDKLNIRGVEYILGSSSPIKGFYVSHCPIKEWDNVGSIVVHLADNDWRKFGYLLPCGNYTVGDIVESDAMPEPYEDSASNYFNVGDRVLLHYGKDFVCIVDSVDHNNSENGGFLSVSLQKNEKLMEFARSTDLLNYIDTDQNNLKSTNAFYIYNLSNPQKGLVSLDLADIMLNNFITNNTKIEKQTWTVLE